MIRPTVRPTLPNKPAATTEDTEDTKPKTIMVDDYEVQIIDENNATIVGFVGDEIGDMPSEANGVPITAIGDYAFAGRDGTKTREDIGLPVHLKTIGDNAFRNCSTLRMVYCFSNITVDDIVRIFERNVPSEYDLDYNVDTYYMVDKIIYGWDSTGTEAIVMDFPSGIYNFELPDTIQDMNGEERDVRWIEKGSMKKVGQWVKIGLRSGVRDHGGGLAVPHAVGGGHE